MTARTRAALWLLLGFYFAIGGFTSDGIVALWCGYWAGRARQDDLGNGGR